MIRIAVADDHTIVRSGLKQLLALDSALQVIGEATNGGEVLDLLRQQPVDVLLLDVNMPGLSGADLVSRVKAHHPTVAVLMLSMHNEAAVASRMLKAGASGYISKDCEPELLLAALHKVANGGHYLAPVIAEKLVFEQTPASGELPHLRLSEREQQIFWMVAQGIAVNDIANQLCISNKTVSTHKARMFEKMHFTNVADVVRYAMTHRLLG